MVRRKSSLIHLNWSALVCLLQLPCYKLLHHKSKLLSTSFSCIRIQAREPFSNYLFHSETVIPLEAYRCCLRAHFLNKRIRSLHTCDLHIKGMSHEHKKNLAPLFNHGLPLTGIANSFGVSLQRQKKNTWERSQIKSIFSSSLFSGLLAGSTHFFSELRSNAALHRASDVFRSSDSPPDNSIGPN